MDAQLLDMEKRDLAQVQAGDSTADNARQGGKEVKGADTAEIREKFRIVKVELLPFPCISEFDTFDCYSLPLSVFPSSRLLS